MSAASVVIVGPNTGLAAGLQSTLALPMLHLGADDLADAQGLVADGRLIWIHAVPAAIDDPTTDVDVFSEASLLMRSASLARDIATSSRTQLVLITVLPSRGLLTGTAGAACDMARSAMESLMRHEIGPWSTDGHRLVSVVHAGIDGHNSASARSETEISERTPMHRLSTIQEVADAVRFIGSERASYITGVSLHIDGGWNAYSWMYPARTI